MSHSSQGRQGLTVPALTAVYYSQYSSYVVLVNSLHLYLYFLFLLLPLCSRQRYVLGDGAMQQMAQSSVFLSGMGGLGIEIGRLNIPLLNKSTVIYLIPNHDVRY